jgi:succinylarginine dihydrolase
VDFFVYGRRGYGPGPSPTRFPARQTLEASQAIARRHGLHPARTVFAQQNPMAVDRGVFHNDVIAVGHGATMLCHEHAWLDGNAVLADLAARVGGGFEPIVVRDDDVTVDEAVSTYLFNSQLIERPDGRLLLVAPAECREHPRVARFLERLVATTGSIADVVTFDLRQSMRNGGGPACLRLRVPLTPDERSSIRANVFLDDALADALDAWIRRNYRDRLAPSDLGDPSLLDESRRALDELTQLLRLPGIYTFQRP